MSNLQVKMLQQINYFREEVADTVYNDVCDFGQYDQLLFVGWE